MGRMTASCCKTINPFTIDGDRAHKPENRLNITHQLFFCKLQAGN